jgi:hypothetical protein
VRAERRRYQRPSPGWNWTHLVVLTAVFFLLGVVAWEVAHP